MKIQNIIEGMQIIARHTKDQYCVEASHEEIFCGDSELPLSESEINRMSELGWNKSEGSWTCFP